MGSRCPTAGAEGINVRLEIGLDQQLDICSLTWSSKEKPPWWHQGWHHAPEPHHWTGDEDWTIALLQHLSTCLSDGKINHSSGMSIRKKKQPCSIVKKTLKIVVYSAHVSSIPPNALFSLQLNSIYNNIKIAWISSCAGSKQSKLLTKTNQMFFPMITCSQLL